MTYWDQFKDFVNEIRGLSKIGSANIIAGAIAAIFWLSIASILGTEEYGKVSYYIAISSLGFTISYLGARHTVVVYSAKEEKKQSSVYFIVIISGLITSIVLFLIFYRFEMSLFVFGSIIFGLVTSELLGFKLYNNYFKYLITQRLLLILLGIGLYFVLGINGVILGFALSFLPFSFRLIKSFKESKIDLGIISNRRGFIMHSYVLDISRNFPIFADKIIVLPLFGFVLLGNYQLGIQFILLLSILPQSVYQFVLPKDAKGEQSKNLRLVSVLFSIVLASFGFLLIPLLVPFLFPEFNEVKEIIQIMSFAIIPITINYMYNSKFLGAEKSIIVLIGAAVYLVTQISGIFILGNFYGINGAAIALPLGASFQSIFYFIADKIFKVIK